MGRYVFILGVHLGQGWARWSRRRGSDLRGIDSVHVVELYQIAQCLPVFAFVIPNVRKYIVERVQLWTPLAVSSFFILALDGAKKIKEKRIVAFVVLARNFRDGFILQALLIVCGELGVRVKGMVLNELRQMVGGGLVPGVDDNDIPVIKEGHGLCNGPVNDAIISAQTFHDQQVMKFVVGLGVVGSHPKEKMTKTDRNKMRKRERNGFGVRLPKKTCVL